MVANEVLMNYFLVISEEVMWIGTKLNLFTQINGLSWKRWMLSLIQMVREQ